MVIKNSTTWDTSDLRLFFRRCVKEVEKVERPLLPFHKRNKHFKLDILNSGTGLRGRATVNGYWIMIKIPRQYESYSWGEINVEQKRSLALLIIHEYYHTIGYRHQDRCNYKYDFTVKYNVDWVIDYPIGKKKIELKKETDVALERYQKAIINLRRAETRHKRAKTIYSKWLSKVKYYEKKYNYKSN